jgi:hypothetical protein
MCSNKILISEFKNFNIEKSKSENLPEIECPIYDELPCGKLMLRGKFPLRWIAFGDLPVNPDPTSFSVFFCTANIFAVNSLCSQYCC